MTRAVPYASLGQLLAEEAEQPSLDPEELERIVVASVHVEMYGRYFLGSHDTGQQLIRRLRHRMQMTQIEGVESYFIFDCRCR